MRDEGDRFVAWRLDDAAATLGTDGEDELVEHALLAYAQRSAARVGAAWFAAEFARREQVERLEHELAAVPQEAAHDAAPTASREVTLVDASVEDDVVGGAPAGLGLEPTPTSPVAEPEPTPEPVIRHPHVPRPPAQQPASEPKRRRHRRKAAATPTPTFVISAPEWARMSPGARRLYGLDASPPAAAAG